MNNQKIRTIYTFTLLLLDAAMIVLAFVLAYWLRTNLAWPEELNVTYPITAYVGFLLLQVVAVLATLFYYRQYYIPRAVSRVDQVYYVIAAVTIGTLIAVALSTLIFKDNDAIVNYPRAMYLYSWLLAIVFIVIGRMLHQSLRNWLRDRGLGRDRLLVVGTGDTARIMLQQKGWRT